MEAYTVWTRQDRRALDTLLRDGIYLVKEPYIREKNDSLSEFYLELYRWFTRECRKTMEIPEMCEFPIWLSMHEEYRLRNTEHTVVLKLRIPREKVRVVSEYAWGYRVNRMYVPESPEDEQGFNRELARYGIGNEAEIEKGPLGNYYPLLRRKLLDSYGRVFSLPPRGPYDELGVCFELRKEWLLEVEEGLPDPEKGNIEK